MWRKEEMNRSKSWKVAIGIIVTIGISLLALMPVNAKDKYETISGRMYGTSTQMGRNAGIELTIYRPSTEEERQVLVQAFKQGQSEGLNKALSKMKGVGRISLTGTIGYDVAFIRVIPTDTGRRIRFVTNRKIAFGEARQQTRSMDYDLTAGEFNLNDKEPKKSEGTLFPAAQLVINKDGELQWELNQNPWRINGIIDWRPKEEK